MLDVYISSGYIGGRYPYPAHSLAKMFEMTCLCRGDGHQKNIDWFPELHIPELAEMIKKEITLVLEELMKNRICVINILP